MKMKPIQYQFGIPAFLVVLLAVQCCRTATVEEEQRARDWLEEYYVIAEQEYFAWSSASWNYNVNITEENRQRVLAMSERRAAFKKETFQNASQFDWKNFSDRNLSRQLEKLSDIGLSVLPVDEVVAASNVASDMQTTYSTANICNRPSDAGTANAGKCYPLDPDVTRIMSTSRNWEDLTWAWQEWRTQTGRKMKNQYSDFAGYLNKAARANGYADNGDYWRSSFETSDFKESVENLWQQVRPLYQQLHAYVRRRLMDAYPQHRHLFPASGHIPAHLTGNMWAQSWTGIMELLMPFHNQSSPNVTKALIEQGYNATTMFQLADRFFTSLGLEPMPPKFWEHSLLEKPKDGREINCHASAWDFRNGEDFRIRQCTDITSTYLSTTHHEMGHVQYYLLYRHQPIVYRRGANPGFHEAIGDLISLSVNTPEHLQKIGLVQNLDDTREADMNFLMKQALQKVAFLPFGYLIDKWRWNVFEGSSTAETYNTDWWKLRCSLQGVSPPVDRDMGDFDAGSKYHVAYDVPYIRYFVSNVIEFQFHKALCEAANVQRPLHRCDIYESQEAGDLLRRTLEIGSSKPWPDAMEVITGQREMDAGPFLEYFQPLHDWLRQENEGYDVTWDDECPPESFSVSTGELQVGGRASAATIRVASASAVLAVVLSLYSMAQLT